MLSIKNASNRNRRAADIISRRWRPLGTRSLASHRSIIISMTNGETNELQKNYFIILSSEKSHDNNQSAVLTLFK